MQNTRRGVRGLGGVVEAAQVARSSTRSAPLRLVLERPWPTSASLRAGLRAVAEVLLPFFERRAVEALDTQLEDTRRAIQKALSITTQFEATVSTAAALTGIPGSRRWNPEAIAALRSASSVPHVARETTA